MRYRVHYCLENDRLTTEVEATSPQEAVVKFRHTRPDGEDRQGRRSKVLSITPIETFSAARHGNPTWEV
ncbi:MAG: hypothetical protein SVV80_10100 [Planctomycetota bacterium]|nr:hypothetical protein [Planctomycetota bacterium]